MHTNITVQNALYLIYENEYHFFLLTSTLTLLSLYLIHSIVALNLQITQYHYTNSQVYTTQLKVPQQLAGLIMVWHFITHYYHNLKN